MKKVGLTGIGWPELESSMDTHLGCLCPAEATEQPLNTAVWLNCYLLSSSGPAAGMVVNHLTMTRLDPHLCT